MAPWQAIRLSPSRKRSAVGHFSPCGPMPLRTVSLPSASQIWISPLSRPTAEPPPGRPARQLTGVANSASGSGELSLPRSNASTFPPLEKTSRSSIQARLSGPVALSRSGASSSAVLGRSAPSMGGMVIALPRKISRARCSISRLPSNRRRDWSRPDPRRSACSGRRGCSGCRRYRDSLYARASRSPSDASGRRDPPASR